MNASLFQPSLSLSLSHMPSASPRGCYPLSGCRRAPRSRRTINTAWPLDSLILLLEPTTRGQSNSKSPGLSLPLRGFGFQRSATLSVILPCQLQPPPPPPSFVD